MSGPLMAGYSIPFNVKNIMGSYKGAQQSAKRRDRALAIAGAYTDTNNPLDKLIAYRVESQIAPAFQEAQIEKLAGDNFRQNEYMEKILGATRDISTKLEERTANRLRPEQFKSKFLQGVVAERQKMAEARAAPAREQGSLAELGSRLRAGLKAEREDVMARRQRMGEVGINIMDILRPGGLEEFKARARMERMREQGAIFEGEEGFLSGPGSAISEPGEAPVLRGEIARFGGQGESFDELFRQAEASGSLMTELFEQQAPPELGSLEVGTARARRKARLAAAGERQMEQEQQRGLEEQVMQSMYGGEAAYGGESAGGIGYQGYGEPPQQLLMERGLEKVMQKYGTTLEDARQAFIDYIKMNPISGDYRGFKRYIKNLLNPTRAVQGTTVQGSRGFEGGAGIRRYEQ